VTQQPFADSVRLALPGEAAQIAAIQRRSWGQLLPTVLRDAALGQVSTEDMTAVWHRAVTRPPESRYRVMVAVQDRTVVGFATTTPSEDPDADAATDGQIDEFVIDPPAQRRGHGSRLMNACIDTLRADGFTHARHWVSSLDDIRRQFFLSAGWAADGSHRELGPDPEAGGDANGLRLRQVRLHSDLTDPTG